MLIGGAVGGLAGNATVDRQVQPRRQQQQEASSDAAMQRQLHSERHLALTAGRRSASNRGATPV